jgi:hypothetical protein
MKMKTLTLHINDTIYEEVKNYLMRFSPDRLEINESNELNSILSKSFLTLNEVEKINTFFKKYNLPAYNSSNSIPLTYSDDDLDIDLKNLKELNLLK